MISMILVPAAAARPAPAELMAIHKVAGAIRRGAKWLLCAEQPNAEGLRVDLYRDLNGAAGPK